ncbi:uncharacterized protein LOC116347208 [Contarinia nasturtii]|uniref:uncharacterized protein LOC116347208 n=1 Tax=Contarinia nasturtii TaxID=265458 RepID=UPI0012D3AD92|nr:uncharacterized protein LOC116347208 [Contarinia nasturtii]
MLAGKYAIFIFIVLFVSDIIEAAPKSDKGKSVASSSGDKVYARFNASNVQGTANVEYQIRSIPSTRFPEALYLRQTFLADETISQYWRLTFTDDEIQKYRQHWQYLLNQGMSLACFDNEDNMVGLAIFYIATKQGSKGKRGVETDIDDELMGFDIFKHHQVKEILANDGLVVLQNYRRRGIAMQILLAAKHICAENKLEVAATVITSNSVNKMATDFGFETNACERFSDDVAMCLRSIKFKRN